MYFKSQSRFLLPFISFLFPAVQSFAQSSMQDSLTRATTVNNALALYDQSTGDQSRLYNGTEYTGYPFNFTEGSPFFQTSQPQPGSIVYDQVEYREIGLIYDNLSDRVIMQDENHRIQLSNEKISRFKIDDNSFIRIVSDSLNRTMPESGFYNILYEGRLTVLKKEIKTIRQIYSYSETSRTIDSKSNYYFRRNNQWIRITSLKELLNFFPDRKKEIQHIIKSNKLNFKKDTDNLLIKVAAWYDQQTN
jgi:hypothetical protein